MAHPHPAEPRGLLITPYTPNPEAAVVSEDWIHRGTGQPGLGIRTDQPEYAIGGSVTVLDYRHYADRYRTHSEWKTSGSWNRPEGEAPQTTCQS